MVAMNDYVSILNDYNIMIMNCYGNNERRATYKTLQPMAKPLTYPTRLCPSPSFIVGSTRCVLSRRTCHFGA